MSEETFQEMLDAKSILLERTLAQTNVNSFSIATIISEIGRTDPETKDRILQKLNESGLSDPYMQKSWELAVAKLIGQIN